MDQWKEGWEAQEGGDYERAIEHYKKAVRENPYDSGLWFNLASIAYQQDRLEDAFAYLGKAAEYNPHDSATLSFQADVTGDFERWEEAIDLYQKAIEQDDKFFDAWYGRGEALRILGRHSAAFESIDRCVALRPGSAYAAYQMGLIFKESGDLEQALDWFEKALYLKPEFANAHRNLADLYWELGRTSKSLQHTEEALRLDPDLEDATEKLKRRKELLFSPRLRSRMERQSDIESDQGSLSIEEKIAKCLGTDELVVFHRVPVDSGTEEGFLLATSTRLILIQYIEGDTMTLNGFSVFRREDISEITVSASFLAKQLRREGISPEPLTYLQIDSWESVLTSLQNSPQFVVIEEGRKDLDTVSIGKVVNIGTLSVDVQAVGFKGDWMEVQEFFYRDITRIAFGDGYTRALERFATSSSPTTP